MKIIFVLASLSLGGCIHRDSSKPQVTNGFLDLGDPFVVMIESYDSAATPTSDFHGVALGRCTASFVTPHILLTAAHCLVKKGTQEVRQVKTIGPHPRTMVAYRIHPDYFSQNETDIALIKLEQSEGHSPPAVVAPLSSHLPISGEQVRVIGFGGNQYTQEKGVVEGRGVKRFGYNTIAYTDSKYLYSKGYRHGMPPGANRPSGESSALAHGDSGGPMVNLQNEIVGVASKIHEIKDPQDEAQAILVAHTKVAAVIDFINKSLEELQK